MTGGVIMSLLLEMSDALKNSKDFYLAEIYKSAKMSIIRNLIETFQSSSISKLDNELEERKLPVENETINDLRTMILEDSRRQFDKDCFNKINFKAAMPFYTELVNSIEEFIAKKKQQNDEISDKDAYNLVESMIGQIADVDEMPDETIKNPGVFEDLESMIRDCLRIYFENVKGTQKCIAPLSSFNRLLRQAYRRDSSKLHS